MSRIQQHRINNHKTRFEDPEEPFVSHDRGEGGGIKVRGREIEGCGTEVFDCAVDGADSDEGRGDVEGYEGGA